MSASAALTPEITLNGATATTGSVLLHLTTQGYLGDLHLAQAFNKRKIPDIRKR